MRAQFNSTGQHVPPRLHPNVKPRHHRRPEQPGHSLQCGRGVVFADVDIGWWSRRSRTSRRSADPRTCRFTSPTTSSSYRQDPSQLLRYRFPRHQGDRGRWRRGKATATPRCRPSPGRPTSQPGIYARPSGGTDWALQDIHASATRSRNGRTIRSSTTRSSRGSRPQPTVRVHRISSRPGPGRRHRLRNGNQHLPQGPNPNGTQSADGYYHPEDEVFLPWFMRTAPNTVSEPRRARRRTSGATR